MCGAECWTDHRLIVSKLSIRIQPKRRPQGKKVPRRLNIMKLKDPQIKLLFVEALGELLNAITIDQDIKQRGKSSETLCTIQPWNT